MWINGIDIADYGGQLRMEYKTSGYQLDTQADQQKIIPQWGTI